ncbi:unnamed protein product [[Candida] boidinii]|uniref:Unnamed protein product n=1 Tax=Candida boidinii TaxID=5477 RepID=A0A9W6WH52_CANBO|nr:unnamed protein product [[Candida] boidinii]GMG18598.1 unnamed protein product [[Candida] boidinii]
MVGRSVKSFGSPSTSITHAPLQLIHADVSGPFPVPSLNSDRYFLTIVDDFTHFAKLYPIVQKSETAGIMQDYIKRAENHFSYRHLKVVSVRTDNGTEFCNSELKNFFDDRGISHERTVPYNSHQNGVAERMHRTIQEKARILLAAAGAAEEFWADAVRTAEFFVNRLPSSAINFEVPFTRWYGYSPDYSLFHSFGCSCHALIPPEKRSSKFSSTAIPAIFVGYSLSHKAYRIYDPVSNEIFISNNVRFDDSTYPWKEKPVFRSSSSHVVTGGGVEVVLFAAINPNLSIWVLLI